MRIPVQSRPVSRSPWVRPSHASSGEGLTLSAPVQYHSNTSAPGCNWLMCGAAVLSCGFSCGSAIVTGGLTGPLCIYCLVNGGFGSCANCFVRS